MKKLKGKRYGGGEIRLVVAWKLKNGNDRERVLAM